MKNKERKYERKEVRKKRKKKRKMEKEKMWREIWMITSEKERKGIEKVENKNKEEEIEEKIPREI